jgi:hypothetical protein
MDDQPDPSIEATRTESQNLSISSHLEGKPDWAFNCRWEDWAASGKLTERSGLTIKMAQGMCSGTVSDG